jgi:hypothetical protein
MPSTSSANDDIDLDFSCGESIDDEVEIEWTPNGNAVTWQRRPSSNDDLSDIGEPDEAPTLLPQQEMDNNDCPRTPPPRADAAADDADPHLGRVVITPDYRHPTRILSTTTTTTHHNTASLDMETVELQLEYLRTLKKLAKLMRRSDETRAIVKRQRTMDSGYHHHNDHDDEWGGGAARNFFASSRWGELEYTRNKVAKMIHYESATRAVF